VLVNYDAGMARAVNPDELADVREVANIIGLTNPNGVSVYRRRHGDFPEPVVEKGRGLLWRRRDVEAWARKTGRWPPSGD
jgi:predicted DNA-binding transcriptional regulator AlpA